VVLGRSALSTRPTLRHTDSTMQYRLAGHGTVARSAYWRVWLASLPIPEHFLHLNHLAFDIMPPSHVPQRPVRAGSWGLFVER
jgi:hypothetical protein